MTTWAELCPVTKGYLDQECTCGACEDVAEIYDEILAVRLARLNEAATAAGEAELMTNHAFLAMREAVA